MKKSQFILFAAVGLFAVACSPTETDSDAEEMQVEVMTYNLDAANSSLQWTGTAGEDVHTGTVKITEGTVTMEDGSLTGGSFVIDMTTMEEPDGQGLVNHLMGLDDNEYHKPADFFNTTKFPSVSVTLGEYNDGQLSVTLGILGQSFSQDIDVALSSDKNGASIKGSFSMNFADLGMPALQPDPETGEGISPSVAFVLNVALIK